MLALDFGMNRQSTTTVLLLTLAILNLPVYVAIGWLIFGSWEEFRERFTTSRPGADPFNVLRSALFTIACCSVVLAEYHYLSKLVFWIFGI